MSDSPAAKTGRPTKYKPEYCIQAAKLCKLGATDKGIADFFDVSEATINNWKIEYPVFLESIKSAKQYSDDEVVKSLYKRALGYEVEEHKNEEGDSGKKTTVTTKQIAGDTTAMIFWLKNRKPGEWRDKQEVDHSGGVEIKQVIRKVID